MKPTYQVRVWPDDDWWLARVVDASRDADAAPLNALTQARSLAKIDPMARDLIATILDADEETFEVDLVYELPGDVNQLIYQAKSAREWADAAQELWQERSTDAAKVLTEKGYSLRETATLLGLSHQRVDQLLGSHAERQLAEYLVLWRTMHCVEADLGRPSDLLVVLRNRCAHGRSSGALDEYLSATRDALSAIAEKFASQLQREAEAALEGAHIK